MLQEKPHILNRLYYEQNSGNLIAVAPVAYYETIRGFDSFLITKRNRRFQSFYKSIYAPQYPDRKIMDTSRDIYHRLKSRGLSLDDNDIYIAAWSVVCGAVLVTSNERHFTYIDDLKTENWR
jgi:tRNA(fMet)-specific endonuclease VapC